MRLKPPKFIRWLMPDLIWEMKDRSAVYLTFDDGPTPGITEWILSTLDKYDAKATFFVLGKNAEMYPDLYRRILDAGHRIGISKTSISPTTCSTPNCSAHPTPASRRRRRVHWANATSW